MIDEKCSGYGLTELIKKIKRKNIVGLEIGCAEGNTTFHLLSNILNLKLYGIDPYSEYIDWNGYDLNEDHMNRTIKKFYEKIEPYKDRHFLYREMSDNVIDKFEDESLDFIFIDGLHTYDQVLKDCKNYYSKVKKGGIFSGHDYTAIEEVNKAVIEFATDIKIPEIFDVDVDVWYWIKP
jgi:predicted O-methyltransferase YrrM